MGLFAASRARPASPGGGSVPARVRAYFASDARRTVQTVLGLIWLLDGGLQFQSFMYSTGFISMLTGMESGEPHWLSATEGWGARIANGNLDLWDTLFGLVQVVIGLGILFRPTVKAALALSFPWMLVVWIFGEAAGMLFASTANPLTGAPGAVLLYGLIGLIVWPNDRPGGLLGVRGTRIAWASLWVVMAFLWLLPANSSADATSSAISAAPSGMSWLTSLNTHVSNITRGNGVLIALVMAAVSLLIGVAVGIDWQARTFLWLAIYLNVIYWVVGQGFGGLPAGGATDPNGGPLFILLAGALYTLLPSPQAEPVRSPVAAPA
ncbi:MAG: hypothetical protein ACRDV4_00845 [Acidimicrobiales bacterium]